MRKPIFFLALLLLPFSIFAQCFSPPSPPGCTGTEALVTDNETINQGTSKWFYGATRTMNSLTMNGGTLTVCGDLTIDKFYMDSGTIYIRPGARFVIGGGIGAGLVLKGNSIIYNYGTLECQRNLSLDNGYASAAKPNRIVNATNSSVFTMANQYLVINNQFSSFVNNGAAHFWGIITDYFSTAGSVCLGNGSTTRMSILINRIANTYSVPDGSACVYVNQYSQFYGRLTSDVGLYACVGASHTSDSGCIPFGCTPNNWGAAQVFTNCAGCASLSVLAINFKNFSAEKNQNEKTELKWYMSNSLNAGQFKIMRSADGQHFKAVDSITVPQSGQTVFNYIDNDPLAGENYYMIQYTDPNSSSIASQTVRMVFDSMSIYPSPFNHKFFIRHGNNGKPEKVIVTDLTGQNISVNTFTRTSGITEVLVPENLQPGIYVIHVRTRNNIIARTILKN